MNINDVEGPKEYPKDMLRAIFVRQREHMEKYEEIEAASGLLQTRDIPVDLNDPAGQARLKDFAWRVTEELAEALEAYDGDDEEPNIEHAQEEIADALHFLVEMTILADIKSQDIEDFLESCLPLGGDCIENLGIVESYWEVSEDLKDDVEMTAEVTDFITRLGCACNCLKNKPWKQTHMLTDMPKFRKMMFYTWECFICIAVQFSIGSLEQMFELYFQKSQVNEFRQRSNY
jgi:hypothetical protein